MRAVIGALALSCLPLATLAATPAQIAAGRKIATSMIGNCAACHAFSGADEAGTVGPALANLKTTMPDRKIFHAIIANEPARNPSTIMPPFGKNLILTPEQINDVIDFLYTK